MPVAVVWLVARSYDSLLISAPATGRKRAGRLPLHCEFERLRDALSHVPDDDVRDLARAKSWAVAPVSLWVNHVVGAMVVRTATLYTSEMQMLGAQQRHILVFWKALHGYAIERHFPFWFVDVLAAFAMTTPARFTVAANKNAQSRHFFMLGEHSVQRLLSAATFDGGTVAERLLNWSLHHNVVLPAVPKLCANAFVFHACLLSHHSLQCYGWPCGKKSGLEHVRLIPELESQPPLGQALLEVPVQPEPFTHEFCQELCNAMRLWQPHVPGEDQQLLASYVRRLQAFVHEQRFPELAVSNQPHLRGMERFVEAMLLALRLRSHTHTLEGCRCSSCEACSVRPNCRCDPGACCKLRPQPSIRDSPQQGQEDRACGLAVGSAKGY